MTDHKAEIERLKTQLGLEPHPVGCGFFKENWKADRKVTFVEKTKHTGPRAAGTSIYFLLDAPNVIKWHKHLSDEAFYWNAGGRLKLHRIHADGSHDCHVLGDVVRYPECVGQVVVSHDTWYSAELVEDAPYSLYSAVLWPGFEFEDWIEGKREELIKDFPQHEGLIKRLT